jgi:uncharacterized protein (DUF885 family)
MTDETTAGTGTGVSLDVIGGQYVSEFARLDPSAAVRFGVATAMGAITDYSPESYEARADLARETLRAATSARAENERDGVARRAIIARLQSELALFDAGEWLRDLRAIGSPLGETREVFDLLPRTTDEDWSDIVSRLRRVPSVLAGYRRTLRLGIERQVVGSRGEAAVVAAQARVFGGTDGTGRGYFSRLASACDSSDVALAASLEEAARAADAAFGDLADFLFDEYAGEVPAGGGAGRERYALWSSYLNGIELDLDETYEWGWADLRAVQAEMATVAAEMAPGRPLPEVVADLENDPGRVVVGVENLRRFLQETMDAAIDVLDGRHFDIAPPVRRVEACIAPPGGAAAMYYTAPSEDFRRPGRTWYPTLGRERFPLWLEVTTAYHEGAPGHHLQLAQSCWLGERINPYLRSVGRVSGQIEGWAVYAERLMDELGLIKDPAYRLGMLACQAFRSARVVTDLGLHLGLRIPSDYPELAGERLGPAVALVVLQRTVARSEAFLRSEIERYLSWPAQAIGYKVGERVWRATREQVRQRSGTGFDLRAFHSAAFALGLVGLQQLQDELAGVPERREER